METKNLLKSLTLRGTAVTAGGAAGIGFVLGPPAATVLNVVGVPIEAKEAGDVIDALFVIGGVVITVVGRLRVKTTLRVRK